MAGDLQCQCECDETDLQAIEMQRAGYPCVCESCCLDRLGNVLRIVGCPAVCFLQKKRLAIIWVVDRMLGCDIPWN